MQEPDHWTNTDGTPAPQDAASALKIAAVSPVPLPLGIDTDAPADASAPPALADWFYGPCPLSGSETKHTADDPCHTYAVIDASRVLGCVEMMEASGLDHMCLYKGETAREMADMAPWLVQLIPDNSFARNLVTDSAGDAPPWHMWRKSPTLYMRSRLDMQALAKHLRRFNKVTDADGSFKFFRYWDPRCFEDFILAHQSNGSPSLFREIHSFILYHTRGATQLQWNAPVDAGGVSVNDDTRAAYRDLRRTRLTDTLTEHFLTLPDFRGRTADDLRPQVDTFATQGRGIGLRGAETLFTFTLGMCLSHHDRATMAELGKIHHDSTLSPHARQTRIMETLQAQIDIARARISQKEDAHV